MAVTASNTPFPLGAYLGNPDASSAANQATYDAYYASYSQLMGTAPQYLASFVDQNQAVSQWVGNSQWAAGSAAASANARSQTPVIALPLNSNASGSATPDQQFQAFASGQYDSVIQGIVKTWAQAGFTNQVFRPGWEMNLQGPTYAGDSAQSQADWVSAFQHVYTVLHQAAAANGVNVQVVWNPGATNYSNAEATTNLYPGDKYVDVVGADVYSDIYPFSDSTNPPTYHDWHTGAEDTSIAQFIADPVNRAHYWSNPAATVWSNDSSGGHSQSLTSLIQFAEQHGKTFAVPETGAGNSNGGTDVSDDAAFPQWLAQQLTTAQAAGEKIAFVNPWDSNGGGNYEFSYASDGKPNEAAAWAKYFGAQQIAGTTSPPATVTPVTPVATAPATLSVGSGSDKLALQVSEDAWQGDAQFTVSVDGTQIGGTQTATASHSAGQTQTVNVLGTFSAGPHTATINFLNDAYGGTAATDRNLYVNSATLDGTAVSNAGLTLLGSGPQGFSFNGATATATVATAPATISVGSGSDKLALQVSEDAWQGDAQFTVSVDGTQIGGTQTATASHSAGQTQTVNVLGTFSAGPHTATINFLNDAYGGTAATDRNLYVNSATLDGTAVSNAGLTLLGSGPQGFSFNGATATATVATSGTDTLDLHVSEDAWQGDAQYTVKVDGNQVGGVRTATALHGQGATQDVSIAGSWGAGPHTVGVSFINDAYGGTAATDRNLYVDAVTYDGAAASGAPATLLANGTANFGVGVPVTTTPLTLHLAEDAWQGNAQYAVAIDGTTVVQNGTVTALNGSGQSQAVNVSALLSAGTHDVAVSFLNDAWGGTSSTDRNLYVKGIDVNATPAPGASATLLSNGTTHFQIVVPSA